MGRKPSEQSLLEKGATPKPKLAKRFSKGSAVWEHALYKLEPTIAKKNVSYRYLQPRIEEVEHSHFYHSKDRKGKATKYCSAMCGHFHEISVTWDGDNLVEATCSEPKIFHRVKIKGSNRNIKKLGSVQFPKVDENTGDVYNLEDNHTHDVSYLGSEDLSNAKFKEQAAIDKQEISGHVSREIAKQSIALQQLKSGTYSNSNNSESMGE